MHFKRVPVIPAINSAVWFPFAAITNYHNFSALKQQKNSLIILKVMFKIRFAKLKIKVLVPSWGSKGRLFQRLVSGYMSLGLWILPLSKVHHCSLCFCHHITFFSSVEESPFTSFLIMILAVVSWAHLNNLVPSPISRSLT